MTTSQYIDDMQREADEAMDKEYEDDLAWQDAAEYAMDDDWDDEDWYYDPVAEAEAMAEDQACYELLGLAAA